MAPLLNRRVAVLLFTIIATAAPLLFGAVDRVFQIGLLVLLALGLALVRPTFSNAERGIYWCVASLAALLILKEFAPSFLFGSTAWKELVTNSLQLDLPVTHHPEPGRALDLLLVFTASVLWFSWVRTLAADRKDRVVLFWGMFMAAVAVAAVALFLPPNPNGIYGLRPSPGWTGYGPFPNRNHTACFLAMGALVGTGVVARAFRRRYFFQAIIGLLLLSVVMVAAFQSKSRGGLIALGIGMIIYAVMLVLKLRSKAALISVGTAGVVAASLFLAFGSRVLMRFHSQNEGDIPTNIRWNIWSDAGAMWKDAPLFGHGLGSFTQIFPVYQNLELENQVVLHPESSWLQSLNELGVIALLLLVVSVGWLVVRHLRIAFASSSSFYLRAGGFCAFAVLLVHSLWDVPAHRWGTGWYALAALAMACPVSTKDTVRARFPLTWVTLLIAAFWAIPFFTNAPAWSPVTLADTLAKQNATTTVSLAQIEKVLRYFPLDPNLHQAAGLKKLGDANRMQEAWQHFRVADRLRPGSWVLPAAQAMAARRYSMGMTLHFWTMAIERAGHRSEEIFQMAVRQTASSPNAEAFWSTYAENNPALLLSYTRNLKDAEAGRFFYHEWWRQRGSQGEVEHHEADLFYQYVGKWGNTEQLRVWMKIHVAEEPQEYVRWAALLHQFGDNAGAWALLSRYIKEPEMPKPAAGSKEDSLVTIWREEPANWVNAQSLAALWMENGKIEEGKRVIITTSLLDGAPNWFRQKAAYLQAAEGKIRDAVVLMLQSKQS